MATDTLDAGINRANSKPTIRELAQDIQVQAHRIDSLAEAIDQALDLSIADEATRSAVGRALDYVHLLKVAVETLADSGEQIEIQAGRAEEQ